VDKRVINCFGLGTALVFVKIFAKLLLGLLRIDDEFRARPEGELTEIAISESGRAPDELRDLHGTIGHADMMQVWFERVK
jgi:hypothetical protein